MRRTLVLGLLSVGYLASCGGGGIGSDVEGFYGLTLSLQSAVVDSPAATLEGNVAKIPPDSLSGSVSLNYSGTSSEPMMGFISSARVCIENSSCFNLPVSGILEAGKQVDFSVSFTSHKHGTPWIVINPFEDETIDYQLQRVTLSGGALSGNVEDSYYGGEQSVSTDPYVIAGSVEVSAGPSTFSGTYTYPSYNSTRGTVSFSLPMGSRSGNSIVANSFRATVGSVVCVDDGSGNVVEQGGGSACSGTIDYNTGNVSISVSGITTPTDIQVSYDVSGTLVCSDDGSGNLTGDCTGTVDYTTGEISYSLVFAPASPPVNVSFSYLYGTSSIDGVNFYYNLPLDGADQYHPQIKTTYGEDLYVYVDGAPACNNEEDTSLCTVTKDGKRVHVQFYEPQTGRVELEYSKRKYYDFNPSVDARASGHLWNGSSTVRVSGTVEVTVKLEDGTKLRAATPIVFDVYGQR